MTLPAGAFKAVPVDTNQLERTSNGTTTLVDATLLNARPITFDISENQLTSLELRFQVTDRHGFGPMNGRATLPRSPSSMSRSANSARTRTATCRAKIFAPDP